MTPELAGENMKCLKCGKEDFKTISVFARTLASEEKYSEAKQIYELLVCNNCFLTHWFDENILSGKERPKRTYAEPRFPVPLKPFKCLNCGSEDSYIEMIMLAVWPHGMEGGHAGEALLRTCSSCGMAEIYEIFLARSSMCGDARYADKLQKTSIEFKCPICASTNVDKVDFLRLPEKKTKDSPGWKADKTYEDYVVFVCAPCQYMMIFEESITGKR